MKKSIHLSLFICFVFSVNTILARTIRVATQKDYYPYSSIDSLDSAGNPTGLLIDWWKLWAEKAEVELEFITGSTNECIEWVENGEADVVAGLFFEDNKNEGIKYSESIISLNTTLFLKRGYRPKSVHEIDRPIGIIKNELSHQNIENKFLDLNLEYFNTFDELREKIREKEIAGFIYDFPYPVLDYREVTSPSGYYQYMIIKSDKIRPGVKNGNAEMLDLLLEGSAKISTDEALDILDEYDDFFKKPIPYEWIIPILILIIVAITIGYLRLFRKQQKQLKIFKVSNVDELIVIISKGENDQVEFKSSLRWDYRQEQPNKALENVIIKTISAFLNTHGGMLLIGVDDEGNLLGLDNDYNSISKNSRDGFILALTNLINQHIGKNAHKFIDINILTMNNKDLCVVNMGKSDVPVYVGKNDQQTFYIRASASSQPLNISEVVGYIKSHWKNN